ncbi:MAG: hypothetical protein M0R67_01410 [Candidatus Cloacimonas sp.]|nr:hypothetical protein [Candidatus Cloacimonas sp.]
MIASGWLTSWSTLKRRGRRFSGWLTSWSTLKRRGRRFSGWLTSWSTNINDEDVVHPEG